jgi:choline dehydrogenase-like flavoprotein
VLVIIFRGWVSLTYDIVIIGAGPAGIVLALELSGAGLRVALLESGGRDFDPDIQELYDGEVTGHDAVDLMAIRLRMFGGTSNHWGGHCTPLDRIDFERAPLSGLTGWPFGYDAIVPYYERAHPYCDLGAFEYGRAAVPSAGDGDFLLPDETRLRTVAFRQSGPLNFGEAYHDRLSRADAVDIILYASATRLLFGADGTATGVETTSLDGSTSTVEGRMVVLACGAIENARLMLVSNDRNGQRFGDAGGLLGKCYMDHPRGGAAFLTLREPARPMADWRQDLVAEDGKEVRYAWRLTDETLWEDQLLNMHFYAVPFSASEEQRRRTGEAREALTALKSIAKWGLGRDQERFSLTEAYCSFITNADSFAAVQWDRTVVGERTDRLLLLYECEQMPTRENYVALSSDMDRLGLPKPVLNWSPSYEEREAIVKSAVHLGRIFGEAGTGRIELEDHFDQRYWDASTSWHQMGTMRMAETATDGVVDANCRVHGTRNVFVAGGAVMPSCGRANPTLTIVALSIRLADHLKEVSGT